jgi:hypothetical protein
MANTDIGEVTTRFIETIKEGLGDAVSGVPSDFNLTQSKYDFTYRSFPSNLGEPSYNGHYMVININVQNGSRFADTVSSNTGKKIRTSQKLPNELSKTDALRFNIDSAWKDSNETSFNTASALLIPRQTRRVVESIALYMPNTVTFDTSNDYEDVGLTAIGSGMASTVAQVASGFAGKTVGKIIKNSSNLAGGAGKAAQLLQRPINPRVEVLFRNTLQRTFQFDFLFAPANITETNSMEQIIKTLRFHSAPEYETNTGSFVYIPPSEFDITFFNRGIENTSIPRINTCALTKISVDYAPQGVYSTFRGTGSPVSCRMQIEFRELEVVSKLRVLQGF